MSDILNISPANSYLTTKQWEEVVEYVKNRKNVEEETVVEEVVENEIVEEPRVMMFAARSVVEAQALSGTVLSSSGGSLAAGDYYLDGNVTLSSNITIANGRTVTIDLNGYVLTGTGSGNVINSSGNLTIIDSNPTSENYGSVSEDSVWIYSSSSNSGTLINGGVITNKGTGSGISVSSNSCTINGGTVAGCMGSAGSAVIISSGGSFYMTGGKILYNYATSTTYGGAVYGEPAHSNNGAFISISNAEISHNKTSGNGGAIHGYIVELSNTVISNNYAAKNGGGIIVENNTTGENVSNARLVISDNSIVSHNGCMIYGGGIYCSGDLNIIDSEVSYNYCGADESNIGGTKNNKGRGGGIYLAQSTSGKTAHGVFDNISLKNNKAMYYGGGIQVTGNYASVTLNSGEISYNESYLGGAGAIHVTSFSTFTMNNGSVFSNVTNGRGGAIHSAYGCTLNLNGGTIDSNEVTGRGAGVHVNVGGIINLNGATIQNNKAFSGYRIEWCKLENGIFTPLHVGTETYEDGYGGGIVIDCGEFSMSKGSILNNYAEVGGGGVALVMFSVSDSYDNKIVKFNLSNGDISYNSTDGDGGGVYLMRNVLGELDRESYPNITDDLINGVPSFTVTGGTINNNSAKNNGGAAYLDKNTECYISGDAIINDNKSSNLGGAIYVDEGKVQISGGIQSGNTSEGSGGAIYVFGDAIVESGTITNNIALDSGGAMAVTSGNVTIGTEECYNAGESSTHTHPVIEGNIASDGGGIYVDGGATTMWCGDIKHNHTYDKTVNVLVVSGGNFTYNGGTIGIPFDSGIFINGGIFEDKTEESQEDIRYELCYNSVLSDAKYNGGIPESKWIASPRGDILTIEDCDSSSLPWADLFPEYEFAGWEQGDESEEVVTLNAIWEKK